MDRLLIIVFFSLIALSCQLTIRPTIPINLNEGDRLTTLRCFTASTSTEFEWILDDVVILRRRIGDAETTVLKGRDPEVYKTELAPRQNYGDIVFKLIISAVSRNDNGRWTCRTNPPEDTGNKVVEVNYRPDPQFPHCEFSPDGRPTCTTQEGKPRVSLSWIDVTGNSRETLREENSVDNPDDGTFFSQVDPADVSPPEDQLDSLICEFIEDGANRNCSLVKMNFFNFVSLKISVVSDTAYICSVTPPLEHLQSLLRWEWDEGELIGERRSLNVSCLEIEFKNLDYRFNGTEIRCLLSWGILRKEESVLLSIDEPPPSTQSPQSTRTTVSSSEPIEGQVTVSPRDKMPTRGETGGDVVYRPTKKSEDILDSYTMPTGTGTDSAVHATVNVTDAMNTPAPGGGEAEGLNDGPGILLIIIFVIVFVVIVVVLVVLVCVCCCGKEKATAAVI